MCEMLPVQFHGDTIYCVVINDQPYTPVKPIVENLGLAWQSQAAKLNANKERWGITMIVIPSNGGEQETLCIPVRKLPAYLASINPNKVREELREKIILYQNECDDALWNYWMNGLSEKTRQKAKSAAEKQREYRERKKLLRQAELESVSRENDIRAKFKNFVETVVEPLRERTYCGILQAAGEAVSILELREANPVFETAITALLCQWLTERITSPSKVGTNEYDAAYCIVEMLRLFETYK